MKKAEAIQSNLNSGKSLRVNGRIDVENRGPVLVARIDGGSHALFDAALVKQLKPARRPQTTCAQNMISITAKRAPIVLPRERKTA